MDHPKLGLGDSRQFSCIVLKKKRNISTQENRMQFKGEKKESRDLVHPHRSDFTNMALGDGILAFFIIKIKACTHTFLKCNR